MMVEMYMVVNPSPLFFFCTGGGMLIGVVGCGGNRKRSEVKNGESFAVMVAFFWGGDAGPFWFLFGGKDVRDDDDVCRSDSWNGGVGGCRVYCRKASCSRTDEKDFGLSPAKVLGI